MVQHRVVLPATVMGICDLCPQLDNHMSFPCTLRTVHPQEQVCAHNTHQVPPVSTLLRPSKTPAASELLSCSSHLVLHLLGSQLDLRLSSGKLANIDHQSVPRHCHPVEVSQGTGGSALWPLLWRESSDQVTECGRSYVSSTVHVSNWESFGFLFHHGNITREVFTGPQEP